MNAPTPPAALAPATQLATAAPDFRQLAPAMILPSQTKVQALRRAHFKQEDLQDLANNLKIEGVHQPILVRPITSEMKAGLQLSKVIKPGSPVEYEIVFGERRFLACGLAGLLTVPCHVRALTDAQVLRIQLVENLLRTDLLPLDEAEGFRAMRDDLKMSVPDIIKEVGKSREYIYGRLKLAELKSAGRKALTDGKIHTVVAIAIARIPSEDLQKEAVEGVIEEMTYEGAQSTDEQLAYIRDNFMLDLVKPPFNTKTVYFDTARKVVKGTSTELPMCETCPKRAANMPDVAGELKKGQDLCTDAGCYGAKREAHATALRELAEKDGIKVISGKAAEKALPHSNSRATGFITEDSAKSYYANNGKTINLQKGLGDALPEPVLIQSPHDGTMVKAYPESAMIAAANKAGLLKASVSASSNYEADQKKKEAAARLETNIRLQVLQGIMKSAPLDFDTLTTIALDYYERLWHENKKRVCRQYGLELCGRGEIETFLETLSGAEIGRFMLTMALIGHCHVDIHHDDKRGAKILRETAARAGVDYTGIEIRLKAEAKEKAKPKEKKAAAKKPAAPAAKQTPPAKKVKDEKAKPAAGAAKEVKDEAGAKAPAVTATVPKVGDMVSVRKGVKSLPAFAPPGQVGSIKGIEHGLYIVQFGEKQVVHGVGNHEVELQLKAKDEAGAKAPAVPTSPFQFPTAASMAGKGAKA